MPNGSLQGFGHFLADHGVEDVRGPLATFETRSIPEQGSDVGHNRCTIVFVGTLSTCNAEMLKEVLCSLFLFHGTAPQPEHHEEHAGNGHNDGKPRGWRGEWRDPVHELGAERPVKQLECRPGKTTHQNFHGQVDRENHDSAVGLQALESRKLVHCPQPLQVVVVLQNHQLPTEEEEHAQVCDALLLELPVCLVNAHLVHENLMFSARRSWNKVIVQEQHEPKDRGTEAQGTRTVWRSMHTLDANI